MVTYLSLLRKPVVLIAFGVAVLSSACGGAAGTPSASMTPTPSPTPKLLDVRLWTISSLGSGPSTANDGDGVELRIPANAQPDPQKHFIAVGLDSKCKLTGDFDLEVDYELLSWPQRNSVRIGLAAADNYSVERSSNVHTVADNLYATDFAGVQASRETQDSTGRLRLTRVGTTITGSYRSSGSWVMVGTDTKAPTDATGYSIAAWTDYDVVTKNDVAVKVTNFTVDPPAAGCS